MFHTRKPFVIGGIIASIILVAFGIAAIVIGVQGRQEVNDTLARENIIGTTDSTIPGQKVASGSQAKAMADVMRKHTLESSGGLTYSEMGKYKTADGAPVGTNDATLAVKDANGKPVSNPARDLWVTETALTTALNTSYFASQVGLFAMVMGVALLLTGVGFGVLTIGAFWKGAQVTQAEPVQAASLSVARPGDTMVAR
ncbi:MAG: hypothetical protein ACRDG3_09900 [Tepidiformaceae bacterium]